MASIKLLLIMESKMNKREKKDLRMLARTSNPRANFEEHCDLCTEEMPEAHRAIWRSKYLPMFEFYLYHKRMKPEKFQTVVYPPDGSQIYQWVRVVKVRNIKVLIPISMRTVRGPAIVD